MPKIKIIDDLHIVDPKSGKVITDVWGDRYLFTIEIWDNATKTKVADEGFNCSHVSIIVNKLEEVLKYLKSIKD